MIPEERPVQVIKYSILRKEVTNLNLDYFDWGHILEDLGSDFVEVRQTAYIKIK